MNSETNPKNTVEVARFLVSIWTATDRSLIDGKLDLSDAPNYLTSASLFPSAIMGLSELDDEQLSIMQEPGKMQEVVQAVNEDLDLQNDEDEKDFETAFEAFYTGAIAVARVIRRKRQHAEA